MTPASGVARRHVLTSCAALAALGAVTFGSLRLTNFRGFDEWHTFWMLSHRHVSVPYANRPLAFLFHVPAWLLAPERLWGFALVHALWLTAAGILVFLLVKRLVRGGLELAFLAAALTIAWMPSDQMRVVTIQGLHYSGPTFATLLAIWLLVEASERRSHGLLLAAGAAGTAAALSIEAVVPLLGVAALLPLLGCTREQLPRRLPFLAAWAVLVVALGLRAALPAVTGSDTLAYQLGELAAFRRPAGVLRHTGLQLSYHLGPLLRPRLAELATPGVWLAVAVYIAGFAGSTRRSPEDGPAAPTTLSLALAGLLGLACGVLAYLPFVLSRSVRGALRTEFLSAAGIATLIASVLVLAARLAPSRLRRALVCALGAWVVAAGTGRTIAMQRDWDERLYAHQRATLQQIVTAAPALRPHTLVALVQGGHTWGFNFTFSKAIEYLYGDAARGWVPRADPFLVAIRVEGAVLYSEPAPVTRGPWRLDVERFRSDEVVAFAEDEEGRVSLLSSWPEQMGVLPPGAVYAPAARVEAGGDAAARLAKLPSSP